MNLDYYNETFRLAALATLDGADLTKTVNNLSALGCRTLWLDRGPHPYPDGQNAREAAECLVSGGCCGDFSAEEVGRSSCQTAGSPSAEKGGKPDDRKPGAGDGDGVGGGGLQDEARLSMVLDVEEVFEGGVVGSSDLLLR